MPNDEPLVSAVDLFCGAGGLSFGLQQAGVQIMAGIDTDPRCAYPFEKNLDAAFLQRNVADLTGEALDPLWIEGSVRVLAGCAPCTPFSPYRRGADTSVEARWGLLHAFGELVVACRPDIVTMENVPRVQSARVFKDFVGVLREEGYQVDWASCYAPDYGLPQTRRRLVLLGSRHGRLPVPARATDVTGPGSVREAIGALPALAAGGVDPEDALHTARRLSDLNLRRMRASRPGGTWEDWPEELRADCHRRGSGQTFKNVYARMSWDEPGPTITTLAHNFGTGRFGHPDQDRAISLREAAILQGFPPDYAFVKPKEPPQFAPLGRLIGNAVPPPLAQAVGLAIMEHAAALAV